MKEKITNVLNKIKENKRIILKTTISVLVVFIFAFSFYNLNNPTYFNKLLASIGDKPKNDAFEDIDFYSCVVESYNNQTGESRAYTEKLEDDELNKITSLKCDWRNIESSKGIEKLTKLTYLNFSGNYNAKNINLSSNTKLKEVDLSNISLKNVDLSNNTSLTNLNLSNNQLTSIDLSNNASLTNLDLSNNQLTSIDLSNNALLTNLNLSNNQLTSIDLSNNASLTNLNLYYNQLTSIDLSNNASLTNLDLSENQLTSIDLSNNVNLGELKLSVNPLTSINGMENLTELTTLDLEGDQLTELNLNNNTKLINLYLSDNKLTSLDLSNNINLSYLSIDGTSLIEDILIQNGETYTIEEKIIPPSGQNFSYSVNDTSVASVSGNIITALKEGGATLRTRFGNVSFERKLAVGEVKFLGESDDMIVNNEEKYIYFKTSDSILFFDEDDLEDELRPNVGKIVLEDNKIKVVVGDKTYLEYDMVYFDGGALADNDNVDYSVVVSSTEEPTKYNIKAVNCTYEFANDGKEVIIKYNGNEIDRKKLVYMYLPYDYKYSFTLLYFGNNILDSSIINNIDDVSQIDKNKVNILNAKMTYETDDENYLYIKDGDERVSEYYPMYIYSDSYDLTKNYIYLGTNDFDNNIQIFDSEHDRTKDALLIINNDNLLISDGEISIYSWSLIKVTSDKYDMSGDKIDLKGENIDLSKINVTNALLKVDNNKLLVMYNDEIVKEFKLENGKKVVTTKPSSEEKTTTKKKSIINKIFGKNKTTTKTTTKNSIDIPKKNTSKDTTKVVNSSNKVTDNKVNKNVIYQDNILLTLSLCLMTSLVICLAVMYKKRRNN